MSPAECLVARAPRSTARVAHEAAIDCCESDQELRLSFLSHRRLIAAVVGLLLEFCERKQLLCERERMRSAVALEEALVNAVTHGNLEVTSQLRDRDDGSFEKLIELRLDMAQYKYRRVNVVLRYTSSEVSFTIRDEGPGFDVHAVPDPRDKNYVIRNSGRGLLLMRAFMDQVVFNEAGNEVTLIKSRVRE